MMDKKPDEDQTIQAKIPADAEVGDWISIDYGTPWGAYVTHKRGNKLLKRKRI